MLFALGIVENAQELKFDLLVSFLMQPDLNRELTYHQRGPTNTLLEHLCRTVVPPGTTHF